MERGLGARESLFDIVELSVATVRAYDSKTEIAMLCFIPSVEALNVLMDLRSLATALPAMGVIALTVFLAALLSFLAVIWPSHIFDQRHGPSVRALDIHFPSNVDEMTAQGYLDKVDGADHRLVAAHTILVLSRIRDRKNRYLILAFYLCLAFYGLCFLMRLTPTAH